MKSLLMMLSLFCIPDLAMASFLEKHDQSIIRSIDDFDLPRNYVEVSEEGLPLGHYLQLLEHLDTFRFTLLAESRVRDIFEDLERDPRARMSRPAGRCSYRRAYIQKLLKERNIVSGKLYVKCPANDGRLRLRDQVSGRNFSYSNFHDTSIVAVRTNAGTDFRVLDLQFEDSPVSLHEYLTEIEASQKIQPLNRRGSGGNKGYCYWSISTPYLTF
ncbi:MAG TPA: protein-glutamine glutaminase family protein [Bacteriovoracaceae bacterium]|nr:protein-glutamine glutaminase family protein [Bacteriovoracaceae bacterium]